MSELLVQLKTVHKYMAKLNTCSQWYHAIHVFWS